MPARRSDDPNSRISTSASFLAYLQALAITAAGLILTALLWPTTGDVIIFLPALVAVAVSAMLGGRGPAVLSLAANALLVDYFFTVPYYSIRMTQTDQIVDEVVFVAVSTFLIVLAERWRRSFEVARSLELARKEAESVQRMALDREHLLTVLAHELRNPLQIVKTSGQLLTEHLRGSRILIMPTDQAKAIETSACQMERLIQDLTDITQIQGNRLTLASKQVDVASTLQHVADLYEPLAEQRQIRLAVSPGPAPLAIWADSGRLLEVFANLIDNALSATPSGGTIRLSAEPQNGFVRFSVSDTGPGIPADEQRAIFEPLVLEESVGSRRGLDLAIARGLVEVQGGRFGLESSAGHGSTFTFTMPTVAAHISERAA